MDSSVQNLDRPELLSITELNCPPGWHLEMHSHAFHNELLVIVGGRIEVEIYGKQVVGEAGSALLYPAMVPHEEWSTGSVPLRMLWLAWEQDLTHLAPVPALVHDVSGRIITLARWLEELKAHVPAVPERMESILQLILAQYLGEDSPEQSRIVMETRAYVQTNLAREITLDDLARAACLSRFRFAHRFSEVTGVPPMKFVRQMRIDAARTLLLNTELPQNAIAEAVGLVDDTHMARVFKNLSGNAPGRVRRGGR